MPIVNTSKIVFKIHNNPLHIKLYYGDNLGITLVTPPMRVSCPIQKGYHKYLGFLQFNYLDSDSEQQELLETVTQINETIISYLSQFIEEPPVESCVTHMEPYPPTLNISLNSKGSCISSVIQNSRGKDIPYFNIEKGDMVRAKITLSTVWKVQGKFYYKWKVSKIWQV